MVYLPRGCSTAQHVEPLLKQTHVSGAKLAIFDAMLSSYNRVDLGYVCRLICHSLIPSPPPLTVFLIRLGKSENVEVLREVAAALRNVSLSEHR